MLPLKNPKRQERAKRLALVGWLLLGVIGDVRADDLISAARATLYKKREQSITILEDAVRKYPKRTDYWVELVQALDTPTEHFLADCIASAALAANPGSPDLLLARARLQQPSSALDFLDELGKLPGHAEEARDAKEVVLLGMPLPMSWREPHLHSEWAARLISDGQWERADKIVRRGLMIDPKDKELIACQALILAERGEFDLALAAQKRADFPQGQPFQFSTYWGLGDFLLSKGKPEFAVKSFGGSIPTGDTRQREMERLVLAQAFFASGAKDEAGQVLKKCSSNDATLLRIAQLVEQKKVAEAHAIGAVLVAPLVEFYRMSHELPRLLYQGSVPQPLVAPLTAAIVWLTKEFPDKERAVEYELGSPKYLFSLHYSVPRIPSPTSESIRYLEQQLIGAKGDDLWTLRNQLVEVLRAAQRYDEAAAASVANILAFPGHYGSAAVEWCICKRRADAVRYFEGHVDRIVSVRRTIYDIDITGKGWNKPHEGSRDWLTVNEVVTRLTAMGPGVLASVVEALKTNTISDPDLSPWIRVIENIGSEQDVPILIVTLALIVKRSSGTPTSLDSSAAVHHALEKLTKAKNTGTSPSERVKFWISWWNWNAQRIVTSSNKN